MENPNKNLGDLLTEKDQILTRMNQVKIGLAAINDELSAVETDIQNIIDGPVRAVRQASGKTTGTVDVLVQGIMVKHKVQKVVVWDQELLVQVRDRIQASGDNPDDYTYAKTTYGITEKDFKAFSPEIKKVFEPARLVKTGKPTIAFDRR